MKQDIAERLYYDLKNEFNGNKSVVFTLSNDTAKMYGVSVVEFKSNKIKYETAKTEIKRQINRMIMLSDFVVVSDFRVHNSEFYLVVIYGAETFHSKL